MEGRVFGYARVSSVDQNLDRQMVELLKYTVKENIITDKASGKDLERPGYQALKGALGLRQGDTLVIMSLDRLSRDKKHIKQELEWFRNNQIRLKVIDLPTTLLEVPEGQSWILDMINNILVEVLASMAEQERLMIRKRQQEGITVAKDKGKYLGRPKIEYPKNWDEVYQLWVKGMISSIRAIEELGMKRTSFYKLAKSYHYKEKKISI